MAVGKKTLLLNLHIPIVASIGKLELCIRTETVTNADLYIVELYGHSQPGQTTKVADKWVIILLIAQRALKTRSPGILQFQVVGRSINTFAEGRNIVFGKKQLTIEFQVTTAELNIEA